MGSTSGLPHHLQRLASIAFCVARDHAIIHIGPSPEIAAALRVGSREGNCAPVYRLDLRRIGERLRHELDRLPPTLAASFDLAKRWTQPVGLLFLEGDGTYEELKAHYQEWGRRVPAEGTLAFDERDIQNSPALKAVVHEMVRPGMWKVSPAQDEILSAIRR